MFETFVLALLLDVVVAILVDVGGLVLGAHAEGVGHQAGLDVVLVALFVLGVLLD